MELNMTKAKPKNKTHQPDARTIGQNAGAAAQSRDPGPEVLRKLHEKGMTRREIAVHLGVSLTSVSAYFQKHRLRTDYRALNQPSRSAVREAINASGTKEAAADRLGITIGALDKLCVQHNIKGRGMRGKANSRKQMTLQMKAATAEAMALKGGYTKLVGTDMQALINAAVAAGQVTRCPPAFAEHSVHAKPLKDADRETLREHQAKMESAA
jgi:predicted transcriptional regulator